MDCENLNKKRPKKTWTIQEDELLRELTKIHGTVNWTLIAEGLEDRTGKQCRERYHNHLQSNIVKGDWTEEEDRKIVELQAKYGNQWAKITKYLPGRTDNAVKNRWHAAMRSVTRLSAIAENSDMCEISVCQHSTGRRHPLVPFLPLARPTSACPPSSSSIPTTAIKKGKVSPRTSDCPSSIMSAQIASIDYGHEMHSHEASLSNRSDVAEGAPSFLSRVFQKAASIYSWNPSILQQCAETSLISEDLDLMTGAAWAPPAAPCELECPDFDFDFEEENDFPQEDYLYSSSSSDNDDDDDRLFAALDRSISFSDPLSANASSACENDGEIYQESFNDLGNMFIWDTLKNMELNAKVSISPRLTISPRMTPRSPRHDLITKKYKSQSASELSAFKFNTFNILC